MTSKNWAQITFECFDDFGREDDDLINDLNRFFETEILIKRNTVIIDPVDPQKLTMYVMTYCDEKYGWNILETELFDHDQENH